MDTSARRRISIPTFKIDPNASTNVNTNTTTNTNTNATYNWNTYVKQEPTDELDNNDIQRLDSDNDNATDDEQPHLQQPQPQPQRPQVSRFQFKVEPSAPSSSSSSSKAPAGTGYTEYIMPINTDAARRLSRGLAPGQNRFSIVDIASRRISIAPDSESGTQRRRGRPKKSMTPGMTVLETGDASESRSRSESPNLILDDSERLVPRRSVGRPRKHPIREKLSIGRPKLRELENEINPDPKLLSTTEMKMRYQVKLNRDQHINNLREKLDREGEENSNTGESNNEQQEEEEEYENKSENTEELEANANERVRLMQLEEERKLKAQLVQQRKTQNNVKRSIQIKFKRLSQRQNRKLTRQRIMAIDVISQILNEYFQDLKLSNSDNDLLNSSNSKIKLIINNYKFLVTKHFDNLIDLNLTIEHLLKDISNSNKLKNEIRLDILNTRSQKISLNLQCNQLRSNFNKYKELFEFKSNTYKRLLDLNNSNLSIGANSDEVNLNQVKYKLEKLNKISNSDIISKISTLKRKLDMVD